jgi:gliding motility-associated protein GldC
MGKISKIIFTVQLDENKVPEKIEWEADDAGFEGKKECSSIMLSLWDKEEKVTLGIDLWTKEMLVDDMTLHIYQTLLKLADTSRKSTRNTEAAVMIENLCSNFADKFELQKK